jgi:hypothetical protein
VLTSNLSVEGLAEVDARLASRLFRQRGIVAKIIAPDYALRQHA